MDSLYQRASRPGTVFHVSKDLVSKVKERLRALNLYNPCPMSCAGYDVQSLFNELCALGFTMQSSYAAIKTLFPAFDHAQQQKQVIRDRDQKTYIARMEQARSQLVQILVLNLPAADIPQELSGTGGSRPPRFLSTQEQKQMAAGGAPIIRSGERRPRRWRQQADETDAQTAEQFARQRERCEGLVRRTAVVDEALVGQVVEACNANAELCYLTAVTSMTAFKRGRPRVPEELLGGAQRVVNRLEDLRGREFLMIKSSGFDIQLLNTQPTKPDFFMPGYDMWRVALQTTFAPYFQLQLYFELEPKEDFDQMLWKANSAQNGYEEQPLIVDNCMWKSNTQFRGIYPLVPPYIDLECDQLSRYGKAVFLKYCYQKLGAPARNYNEEPILNLLLHIQSGEMVPFLQHYERSLQGQLLSTIDTKRCKKAVVTCSYFMDVYRELHSQDTGKEVKREPCSISPLLLTQEANDVKVYKSSLVDSEGRQYYIEDAYCFYSHKDSHCVEGFGHCENEELARGLCGARQDVRLRAQSARQDGQRMSKERFSAICRRRNHEQCGAQLQRRQSLPIYQSRAGLLETIRENDVVVIRAETGTGKSTNLPQLILEQCERDGEPCKMVVTQPRKIAAISIAQQVARQSGFQMPTAVGYAVKGKSQCSAETIILYCTVGVLVRRIVQDAGHLGQYTHVLIDEVHERDVQTDVLLGIVRIQAQFGRLPKIIIMSATLDGGKFCKYFGQGLRVKTFELKGRAYKVDMFRLDDYYKDLRVMYPVKQGPRKAPNNCLDEHSGDGELDDYFEHDVALDEIDDTVVNNELIREIISAKIYSTVQTGNTLVFMPGLQEICQLYNYLGRQRLSCVDGVYQCYGGMHLGEEQKLFDLSPGTRNVIIATNVAEASITLPDVVAVIDTGLERRVTYSPHKKRHVYKTQLISRESAQQRAGRAGRVRDGLVYCTYTEATYNALAAEREPEVMHANIAGPIMQLCLLHQGYQKAGSCRELLVETEPHTFFQELIDHPPRGQLANNLKELVDNKFLCYQPNHYEDQQLSRQSDSLEVQLTASSTSYTLTQFGEDIAFLPIEPAFCRILYYSRQLGQDTTLAKVIIAVLTVGLKEIVSGGFGGLRDIDSGSDVVIAAKLLLAYIQRAATRLGRSSNESSLMVAKDTLWEILEDDEISRVKQRDWPSDDAWVGLLACLELCMRHNICFTHREGRQYIYLELTQHASRNVVRIHNSSVLFGSKIWLFQYCEELQLDSKVYAIGCSRVNIAAILLANEFQIDYRNGCIRIRQLEISCGVIDAYVLKQLLYVFKKYQMCGDLVARLIEGG